MLGMKGALSCDVRDLEGKSLGGLLTEKETDLVLLKAIKASSKRMSKDLVSDAAMAIATAIYYGALASAVLPVPAPAFSAVSFQVECEALPWGAHASMPSTGSLHPDPAAD